MARGPKHRAVLEFPARPGRKARVTPFPPPEHLSVVAKRVWPVFEGVLREMGTFRPEYALAMERACELYADIVDLTRIIRTEGRFYNTTSKAGDVMIRPHPAQGQLADTDRRFATYLAEFSLTPAGRAKLLSLLGGANSGSDNSDPAKTFGF